MATQDIKNNEYNINADAPHKNNSRVCEAGRSMTEMLGVLAVIGVLSVGGIMGYKYGMDKYRANEIINDVNMRMIDIAGQVFRNQSEIAIPDDWDIKGRSGYIIDVFQNTDSEPSIMVEKVPTSVCKMILQNSADTQDIYVGVLNGDQVDGNWYLGDNEHICEGSDKEMLFAMSPEILAGFNPDSEDYVEPEGTATLPPQLECYSNADCDTDKPYCNNGGQCISCPSEKPLWNETYKVCSECLDNSHCTDSATPYCNEKTGKCVRCLTNGDCDSGQYCADANTSYTEANPYTCKNLNFSEYTIDGTTYYVSNDSMTWWDADAACKAMKKNLLNVDEFFVDWNGEPVWQTRSPLAEKLYEYIKSTAQDVWTQTQYDTYCAWSVNIRVGGPYNAGRKDQWDFTVLAVCR